MSLIVCIHATDGEYTETECAAVEDIVGAKLAQHLVDRSRYIRPKDSSVGLNAPEAMAHAGSVPLGAPALSLRCPECAGPLVEDQPDHGVYCPACWAWECRQEES